jgi:hypothetical protein
LALLQQEFPELPVVALPAYAPRYSRKGSLFTALFFQLPKFLWVIHREHRSVARLIQDHGIDFVFSDNRYGCWSRHVPSVFITHQLAIVLPKPLRWAEGLVRYLNHRQIRKFTHCWVPDYPDQSLSGKLSDARGLRVNFIGPLTRFERPSTLTGESLDVLAMVSGPEPQRSLFLARILAVLRETGCHFRILAGQPEESASTPVEVLPHLPTNALQELILSSRLVICRSGYSSLMDLSELGKAMLLVPTPGQTEQLYLAAWWEANGWAVTCHQEELSATRVRHVLQNPHPLRPKLPEKTNLNALISRVLAHTP